MFKNIKICIPVLLVLLFVLASSLFAENWPNLHRGNTLIKDGQLRVVDGNVTLENALNLDGSLSFGTDTVTMTSADPGNGTVTPSVTSAISYYIITDATGSLADQLDFGDGVSTGQQIRITLDVDAETAGLKIVPTNKFIGTSTLLEDKGDCITYEWTGSAWNVISNIGGTEL